MLFQYNFQTSKIGQSKVNLIYSKNETSSKITIINGTRLKIRYPYNLKNNLTSNIMVIKNLKSVEAEKEKAPNTNRISGVPNCNSLKLKVKKVRILTKSLDKNIEKIFINNRSKNNEYNNNNNYYFESNFHTNRLKDETSNDFMKNPNNNDNNKNFVNGNRNNIQSQMKEFKNTDRRGPNGSDNFRNESGNLPLKDTDNNTNNNLHFTAKKKKLVSPILNLPINISKIKVLPSIMNKNSSRSSVLKINDCNNNNTNKITKINDSLNDDYNCNYFNTVNNNNQDTRNNFNSDLNLNITNNEKANFGLNNKPSMVNYTNSNSKRNEQSSPSKNGVSFLKRIRHNHDQDRNSSIMKNGANSLRNKNRYMNKDLKEFNDVININNSYIKQEEFKKEFNSVIHTSENLLITQSCGNAASPYASKKACNEVNKNEKSYSMVTNPYNKLYLFIVRPGNNPDVIRKCFAHRANWKECSNLSSSAYNYKWGQTKKSMEFCLLNKATNKKKNNLNAFDYIPFTVVAKINSNNWKENFKNFSQIFNNIGKYIEISKKLKNKNNKNSLINKNSNNTKIQNNNTHNYTHGQTRGEAYCEYFKTEINDFKALNTEIKIPSTHFKGKNLWLVKPTDLFGGRCIQISDDIEELEKIVRKFFDGIETSLKAKEEEEEYSLDEEVDKNQESGVPADKTKAKVAVGVKYRASTVLIQKYIESPLLYCGRKFDVRMWVLITHKMEVFMFKEGHLKTTCTEYTTESKDRFIHITNYSLQKHNNNFNRYEEGNEVSFKDFQDFLDKEYPESNIKIKNNFYPQMIEIIKHSTLSIKDKLNKKNRQYCYVTFGYDFMIDSDLRVWLIEINKNPGLCESSNIIKVLIPRMIDDSLRLTVDEVFEPKFCNNNDSLNYKSPFPVEGYNDRENMWQYLHSLYN